MNVTSCNSHLQTSYGKQTNFVSIYLHFWMFFFERDIFIIFTMLCLRFILHKNDKMFWYRICEVDLKNCSINLILVCRTVFSDELFMTKVTLFSGFRWLHTKMQHVCMDTKCLQACVGAAVCCVRNELRVVCVTWSYQLVAWKALPWSKKIKLNYKVVLEETKSSFILCLLSLDYSRISSTD